MRTFRGKIERHITVRLIDEAQNSFQKLEKIVEKQQLRNITASSEIKLHSAILKICTTLKSNPFYGENAKKALIPKKYIKKYGVTNIFIVDLPEYWRFVYTIESDKVEIFVFVLDIFSHDKYNKKFGFEKRCANRI